MGGRLRACRGAAAGGDGGCRAGDHENRQSIGRDGHTFGHGAILSRFGETIRIVFAPDCYDLARDGSNDMACQLRKDPSRTFCAFGAAGATATVFIEGPPTARVTNALMNDTALAIGADGRIRLTPLKRGTNPLEMVIAGLQTGDEVTLSEACDDDTTQTLCGKRIGDAPGGGNPVVIFRLHAD